MGSDSEEEATENKLASLQRQLAEAQENLGLIDERISQFVQETDVPLQLIKDQHRLRKWIRRLERRLEDLRPMEVLRTATKLVTGPVVEVLAGEQWKELNQQLLTQASRLPRASYLDTALLEASLDDLIRLVDDVRILLAAYRIEPNPGLAQALRRHASKIADYLLRIYRLPPGDAPELETLARDAGE